MKKKYYEDFEIGRKINTGKYTVTREEIIEFAEKWDPQPIHMDETDSSNSIYKGVIAPGCFIISAAILLVNKAENKPVIIAAIGWDEIRFLLPVRPGDCLSLVIECIGKRESESSTDQGIVQNFFTLKNQNDETVFTFRDHIIVKKKNH